MRRKSMGLAKPRKTGLNDTVIANRSVYGGHAESVCSVRNPLSRFRPLRRRGDGEGRNGEG